MTAGTDGPGWAERVAQLLDGSNLTVAAAESVSAGCVAQLLAAAPDASRWFRGSVVSWASEVKFEVLGVPEGPVVTEECARHMAAGARKLLDADVAVGVTGCGGPDTEEGCPPGTVFIAVCDRDGDEVHGFRFPGDPAAVVQQAAAQAAHLLHGRLALTRAA